ncbi:VOC family protein [Shewanella sp. 3B26]|uniref:VOC family protein n=1 Tax=Shewanella zhuhaiensis TaxID=2919576 RepID=A0AAJ1BFY0_9GAMM|nr:VOC family protein [Shewanella zhuhaiensis]MCH4294042.1 VOC family protein [Shewanella zhuhaiensis]
MLASELYANWAEFEANILKLMKKLGLDGLKLECDHASLRVNSVEGAEQLKADFANLGDIISDNIINGRPILIIRLHQPLILGSMSVPCIELPFPSEKRYPQEGWEHIELVLPGADQGEAPGKGSEAQSCEELAAQLIARVPSLAAVLDGNTDVKVKMSSPKGEAERLANPTIAFGYQGLTVKVHPHSIEAIVASEQARV